MDGRWELWGVKSPGRAAIVGRDLTPWADQKYVRGMSHLSRLLDLARSWDAGRHTWLDLRLSEDRHATHAYLRIDPPPPLDEMSLLLGDALHCLRGALDSLTWELCHLDGPPDPFVLRKIQFPCARSEADWTKQVTGPLASMPPDFQQRIYDYQPLGLDPATSVIALLFDLNNQDKHRGAISASANVRAVSLPINTAGATGAHNGISNGFRINFAEPQFVNGALALTLETSVPITLLQDSTPVGLSYTVDNGPGRAIDLAHLVQVLALVGPALQHIRDGLTRDSMPAPSDGEGASEDTPTLA
jgi:hypothetical protein